MITVLGIGWVMVTIIFTVGWAARPQVRRHMSEITTFSSGIWITFIAMVEKLNCFFNDDIPCKSIRSCWNNSAGRKDFFRFLGASYWKRHLAIIASSFTVNCVVELGFPQDLGIIRFPHPYLLQHWPKYKDGMLTSSVTQNQEDRLSMDPDNCTGGASVNCDVIAFFAIFHHVICFADFSHSPIRRCVFFSGS